MRSRSSSLMTLAWCATASANKSRIEMMVMGVLFSTTGQMTNAVQVHQLQTVCERLRKINFDNISDHDVRYRRKFWRLRRQAQAAARNHVPKECLRSPHAP